MASHTRNRIPRPAVYRKRHKALQHLTDANTNHGFGQRIVIQDVGHKSNGDSCFGISGPSGVQMFQPVNPGNYREAATKKEPKYRQMPARQTGSQIDPRSGRDQQKIASSTSPPIHVQSQRVEQFQVVGYQDLCQEPGRQRDGVTATQIPAVAAGHASRQYANTPRYSMQAPLDGSTFTSENAEISLNTWSQYQSQSPISSDYSDLSDTPDASWQYMDLQRFDRVSTNVPYSGVGPTTVDSGHMSDRTANNGVDYGGFHFLTDGLGFPAYSQGDGPGDSSLQWGESVLQGPVFSYAASQIYDQYECPWVARSNSDHPGSSIQYSRDTHIENQAFLTYQYPATDYN
ncbi:hypothetical protein CPB83DRAFT_907121 [Crepidotus variabilis]|uniref:Uncharacterized protein n=1 Tax=Crepidotus variabilis TaxID=179855 RepID=A0A9P6JPR3_9AGAR|nr:hypothetical protein CPB83DRAFT_907121 [Crepidotus variabilis]